LDPSLSLARVLLGEIYEKQERYEEALKLYGEEKETSETYFASQVRMGIIFAKQGDLKGAEKKLRFLAEKRPELAFPWIELGDIFIANKKYPQAISAFSEAINRIPVLNRSHWSLFYSRGAAYERDKQWELAEQDLLQALVLSPDQPLTLNYLGYSWIERGKNIAKAKEMLERAVFLSPREGFIADSLGWAYYLLKDYAHAVAVLESAVIFDPGSGVINDHLGDAYWRVGRKREARFQWTKALSVKNDFSEEDKLRVEAKLEKGLDEVGDKVALPSQVVKKTQKVKKSK
jgi:tetratricopeptide (TPR) repeat protein